MASLVPQFLHHPVYFIKTCSSGTHTQLPHIHLPLSVAICCPTFFPTSQPWTSMASASRPTTPCSALWRWALFLPGFGSASLPGCSSASQRWTCRYWKQQNLTMHLLYSYTFSFLHSWPETSVLCSHLSPEGTPGASAAGTLWSTALLEPSRGTVAAPSESDVARPSTGRRDCWSLLMEVTSGQSCGEKMWAMIKWGKLFSEEMMIVRNWKGWSFTSFRASEGSQFSIGISRPESKACGG